MFEMNKKINKPTFSPAFKYIGFQSATKLKLLYLFKGLIILLNMSCKKLVEIPPPATTIETSQTFSTQELATSAMLGVYHKMINADGNNFGNGAITIYTGVSSDEFNFFFSTPENDQFQSNSLSPTNGIIGNSFWGNGFSIIYAANSVLEGLTSAPNISESAKNKLTGEAKFVRAFCNFYLCNLFGDIPLVNETNWRNTKSLSRASVSQVYQQIIVDLNDAVNLLPPDYDISYGQRIIPNKWSASALLARVYLYEKRWEDAERLSGEIISQNSLFNLDSDLRNVFKINSSEAIWQLQQSNTVYPYNATNEGERIIPLDANSQPYIIITNSLLNSFEPNDKRKTAWIDSTFYELAYYFYPRKYEVGPAQRVPNGSYTEYYMVLRLAEQYLIRAEARAMQNKLSDAMSDLNEIRQRAGLPELSASLTQQQIIDVIIQERKIELLGEWSHRWFDLKRYGISDLILAPIKGADWQTTDQLYPIPQNDRLTDPNLSQNKGY